MPHSKFHALCLCLCGGKNLSTVKTSALKAKSGLNGPHVRHFGCLLDGYYTIHYVPPPISCNAMTLQDLLLTTTWIWT